MARGQESGRGIGVISGQIFVLHFFVRKSSYHISSSRVCSYVQNIRNYGWRFVSHFSSPQYNSSSNYLFHIAANLCLCKSSSANHCPQVFVREYRNRSTILRISLSRRSSTSYLYSSAIIPNIRLHFFFRITLSFFPSTAQQKYPEVGRYLLIAGGQDINLTVG